MNNLLFCSVGRRGRLLRDVKETIGKTGLIVGTDLQSTAPALQFCDRQYVVPPITAPDYIDVILDICKANDIKAVTTLIDPEIEILARNSQKFKDIGVIPLCPASKSAIYCFDKYELFKYCREQGIRTPLTFHDWEGFIKALGEELISFPVFMKPICGSGSVGAHKVYSLAQAEADWNSGEHDYIIQELMTGGDCDADVYVDTISHKAVAAFSKKKIETRIGGASKTISFKDPKLFAFIEKICSKFEFNGALDMDFFIKDGEYYLSEINPRFGGAYLHAYGAGVDFIQLIVNNINGIENQVNMGGYDDDVLMLMYDDVVIARADELVDRDFTLI